MSVRVDLKLLTPEHKKHIRKHLCMQPKESGFFKNNRFYSAPKESLILWYIDKSTNELVAPYTFMNGLLKTHINSQNKYPICKFNFTGTLRPHQIPIVNKAYQQLTDSGTTTLGVYPSCGKTVMSACLSSNLKGLILVVYPIKVLATSWYNTYTKYTDAIIWMHDGKTPPPETCNVILTMDTMFHKIPTKILKMVKILIVDEAHMFCTKSRINSLLGTTPQYVIACTATLKRANGMESIIHSICGTHGIFIKYPYPFTVIKVLTNVKIDIELNKRGETDWSKIVKSASENPERNRIILNLVKNNYKTRKIMILSWNKDHAVYLSKEINKMNITSDYMVGNKNNYKDSRVLCGSIGKLSCGFDAQMTCEDWQGEKIDMMILSGSTKSVSLIEQEIGRALRANNAIIYDLVDDNRICKSHWRIREKFYLDPEMKCTLECMKINKDKLEKQKTENEKISMVHKSMLKRRIKLNII